MKKYYSRFTLVEMLTVIAIIAILAALITAVVATARQKGRIASAQTDITAIMTALKGIASDHRGDVLNRKDGKFYIGGVEVTGITYDKDADPEENKNIAVIDPTAPSGTPNPNTAYAIYDALITELSNPHNSDLAAVSTNKRYKTYLNAQNDFDPSKGYKDQCAALYRDPWGNPYRILIKVAKNSMLYINANKTISGGFAVYSCGPDGKDDGGCHAERRICSDSDCKHDDVASWNF